MAIQTLPPPPVEFLLQNIYLLIAEKFDLYYKMNADYHCKKWNVQFVTTIQAGSERRNYSPEMTFHSA